MPMMPHHSAASSVGTIPHDELQSFVRDFPALLWRIEIERSRIEFLNNHVLERLGDDTRLFLKNPQVRHDMLVPEDGPMLDAFMEAIKDGKPAAVIFRVFDRQGEVVWLKLTGATNTTNPRFYYGYLLDVSESTHVIRTIMDADSDPGANIEGTHLPTLLVDARSGRVLRANRLCVALLGLSRKELVQHFLMSLLSPAGAETCAPMLATLPTTRRWSGKLLFAGTHGQVEADTSIRYMDGPAPFLRVALRGATRLPLRAERDPANADNTTADWRARIATMDDMGEMLQLVLHCTGTANGFEGIIFSDVEIRRNRVTVYGAGDRLVAPPHGEVFPYKGTIAEDMERYGLDLLIVDDTQDSIKPIDWALFVPRGIRSYFARAFRVRGVLRTVLVVWSATPGRFSNMSAETFDSLLHPIEQAARHWRKRHRR